MSWWEQLPALVKSRPGAKPATLEYVTDLQSAVEDAWYIVESVPEIPSLKIDILGRKSCAASNPPA
jgi:3-hydroxybutyryl-CoA dehydrogenase